MTKVAIPAIEVGDTITAAALTDFTDEAFTAFNTLEGENLRNESIGRYHFNHDSGNGALVRYGSVSAVASTTYSNTTGAVLSHGAGSQITVSGGGEAVTTTHVMRVRFSCLVQQLTIDSANSEEDMYYFRFGYDDSGSPIYPGPDWGFSMLVRNSNGLGGTLSADANIDTSAYDDLNKYQWRHVTIEQVFNFTTNRTIDRVFVEFFLQNGGHVVEVGSYLLSYEIFQG